MRAFGTLAVVLVSLFAGCVGLGDATPGSGSDETRIWTMSDPALSQPIYDEVVHEHIPLTASDGETIDAWMYRPVTPSGVQVPTILLLSPYFGASLHDDGHQSTGVQVVNLLQILNQNFTKRGYAVVGASVRGTGFSGGCFEIGGLRERKDYQELIDMLGTQSWSNGYVGLVGVSYDGTAPQAALVSGAKHLRTIVPIAAISDLYKYNWINGVPISPQGYVFNTYYAGDESYIPNVHGVSRVGAFEQDIVTTPPSQEDVAYWPGDAKAYATRTCPTTLNGPTRGPSSVDTQRSQLASGPTGVYDAYWDERNFARYLDNAPDGIGVFVVHGLIDMNVKPVNLLPWYQELKDHGLKTKILLGQWHHAYPGETDEYSDGTPNGPADWNVTLLRWFDYWLKGLPTGIMEEPEATIQDFDGVWRTEGQWPPKRAKETRFFLDADGTTNDAPGTGSSMFTDAQGQAATVVNFTTPEFKKPFRWSGAATVSLELSHSVPRGQVAITVYNVTGSKKTPVNWGFFNYNIRNDPHSYDPVVPDERFHLDFTLMPTDMVIAAGSHMEIRLAGTNHGGPGMLPIPSGGTTTVFHGETTFLEFPVLPGIDPLCPQPPMVGREPNPVC